MTQVTCLGDTCYIFLLLPQVTCLHNTYHPYGTCGVLIWHMPLSHCTLNTISWHMSPLSLVALITLRLSLMSDKAPSHDNLSRWHWCWQVSGGTWLVGVDIWSSKLRDSLHEFLRANIVDPNSGIPGRKVGTKTKEYHRLVETILTACNSVYRHFEIIYSGCFQTMWVKKPYDITIPKPLFMAPLALWRHMQSIMVRASLYFAS